LRAANGMERKKSEGEPEPDPALKASSHHAGNAPACCNLTPGWVILLSFADDTPF
jgi:hypothetical protein